MLVETSPIVAMLLVQPGAVELMGRIDAAARTVARVTF
jgi:hypothetical protein